ncbi:pyrimidine reductase family protein [Rhodococcus koreensis]|uniref:pyrimidine reductase family protein n=1 Tax=Rhodococcus koreensis TaxID=99653 RepID=UPI0036704C55
MHRVHIATFFTPDRPPVREESSESAANTLRELYAYPSETPRPWIRVNFVSSIDGAVSVDGVSGALGTPADALVFATLRELADVVLVGAGTVRAENYGGARVGAEGRRRRVASGMPEVPPIAVLSARAHLDPQARLFTDTEVAPIVVTCADADPARIRALTDAGARIVTAGDGQITSEGLLAALDDLGLRRVLCEGGPSLFGQLIADDAVDEVCLTTAPVLAGGTAGRVATAPNARITSMTPAHILTDTDGTVLTRWVRMPRP